jgi:hypothetical protein
MNSVGKPVRTRWFKYDRDLFVIAISGDIRRRGKNNITIVLKGKG